MDRTTDYNPIIEDPDFLNFDESNQNEIVVSELNSRHQGIEFDEQLANAQQQLKELKKQEEEIEKQKAELEFLRQMQSAFNRGKVEMLDNLQHAITLLERERLDAEQRILQYSRAQSTFKRTIDNISLLNPDDCTHGQLHEELTQANNVIDDARDEYMRTLKHLDSLNSSDEFNNSDDQSTNHFASISASRNFRYWFKSGFAFSLPLIVFISFVYLTYKYII